MRDFSYLLNRLCFFLLRRSESLRYVFTDPCYLLVILKGNVHIAHTYLSLTSGGYQFYPGNLYK